MAFRGDSSAVHGVCMPLRLQVSHQSHGFSLQQRTCKFIYLLFIITQHCMCVCRARSSENRFLEPQSRRKEGGAAPVLALPIGKCRGQVLCSVHVHQSFNVLPYQKEQSMHRIIRAVW